MRGGIRDIVIAFTAAAAAVFVIVFLHGKVMGDSFDEGSYQVQETVSEAETVQAPAEDGRERRSADGTVEGEGTKETNAPVAEDPGEISSETVEVTSDTDSMKELLIPEALIIDGVALDLSTVRQKLPAAYDSRNADGRDYVTDVKDQGYTRLCWLYAGLGAVESDIIRTHSKIKDSDINLSEKHLAYYNMHPTYGSWDGLIDEDYRELVSSDEDDTLTMDYGTGYVMAAGVPNYLSSLLMAWKGPVEDTGRDSFASMYGKLSVYTDNADLPSDAYKDVYCHVMNALETAATEDNRDVVKHLIMDHGAVTASVCTEIKFWDEGKKNLYDHEPYEGENRVDHEVLVIGWDDDYPAENFAKEPSSPGAWICRNTWGESVGDKGYFHLSYEDTVANANNMVAYDCALPGDDDWYDHNYQVAGFLTQVNDMIVDQKNMVYAFPDTDVPYAVVYEAVGDETLKAVALFTARMNSSYIIDIYVSDDDLSGTDMIELYSLDEPVVSQEVSSECGGFLSFRLDQDVELERGQSFIVAVTPQQKEKLVFEKDMDYVASHNVDDWGKGLGSVHTINTASGRSYLGTGEGRLVRQTGRDFFLKAYTCDR